MQWKMVLLSRLATRIDIDGVETTLLLKRGVREVAGYGYLEIELNKGGGRRELSR